MCAPLGLSASGTLWTAPWPAARVKLPCRQGPAVQDYLLVDGYNIIFAWDELKELARENIEAARAAPDILCNYQGFRQCRVILVFDAYKVRGGRGEVQQYGGICIVYTKEAETADMYIEKATYQLAGRHRVRVATSDGAEQLIILGHGAPAHVCPGAERGNRTCRQADSRNTVKKAIGVCTSTRRPEEKFLRSSYKIDKFC